jgi:hypothetical protein
MRRSAFVLAVTLSQVGCAVTPPPKPKPPPVKETPENAAEIARDIVRGRAGALFEVGRFRFHTGGSAIGRLAVWGPSLEKLGLDPLYDVDRAFVTSEYALGDSGIAVLEMNKPDRDVAAALAASGLTSNPESAFPATHITLKTGETRVVALVRPGLVVVAPTYQEQRLDVLRTRARLPRIPGRTAARFFAFEPASSLGSLPRWPTTVFAAHAELEFNDHGGAVIRFFAESTSEKQAVADAAALTEEAHHLLALDLGIFEMHLLDPPSFRAEGRRVMMHTGLLPQDVDWLLRFTGKP